MSYLNVKRRRDLKRRRWQYGAAALTIFLGVMIFATSYDAYRNLDLSYRGTYDRLAFADVTVTGAQSGFASDVRAIDGVAVVEPRVQADLPMRVNGDKTFIGRMVGMPAGEQPQINRVDVLVGEYLGPDSSRSALAETHMFDHFALQLGDTVEYFDGETWRGLDISGSALSPEYVWPARNAQDVLSLPGSFGVLFVDEGVLDSIPTPLVEEQDLVLYDNDVITEDIDSAVRRAASDANAASVVVLADQPSNKVLQLDVTGFEQMAIAFPVMFLLAAGMATYTLMTRLVYQEREIIGTLRANGLSRREVVRHYLSYGLWLGGISGVLGVVVGMPLGWLSTEAYTAELGIPDTVRGFYWTTIVIGILFGVATGLVSAWVPARSASRLDPAEAMRGDMTAVVGHTSLVERLFPVVRRIPTRWRMVVRGIGRNKRRSFSTVLGVVLALVLIMASWGLIDSMRYLLTRQYTEIQHDDATIIFDSEVSASKVGLVDGVPGVSRAESVLALGVSVKGPDDSYTTQLLGFDATTEMHQFEVPLPDQGVLLGRTLRDQLGLKVGDVATISCTGLDTTFEVPVAGFLSEPLGTFAYMRKDVLTNALAQATPAVAEERLTQPDSTVVMALFDDGADRQSVLDDLGSVPGVASVTDSRELFLLVQDYMGLFYVFVGMMLAFGGLLAFALIFNTMSVNLAERATELATMRANGLSRGQAARLVVWENLLLTIIGIPFGLAAGYWAASVMMASYSSDLFVFDLHFEPLTYLWCALSMIAVTLISLWPGVRAAQRVDIGSIVRQRSM